MANAKSIASLAREYKVGDITELSKMPRREAARGILARVARQVEPICHAHQWRVLSLEEFYPKADNLLGMNVNHGWKVYLRREWGASRLLA
jgi:hypothetical protein